MLARMGAVNCMHVLSHQPLPVLFSLLCMGFTSVSMGWNRMKMSLFFFLLLLYEHGDWVTLGNFLEAELDSHLRN